MFTKRAHTIFCIGGITWTTWRVIAAGARRVLRLVIASRNTSHVPSLLKIINRHRNESQNLLSPIVVNRNVRLRLP